MPKNQSTEFCTAQFWLPTGPPPGPPVSHHRAHILTLSEVSPTGRAPVLSTDSSQSQQPSWSRKKLHRLKNTYGTVTYVMSEHFMYRDVESCLARSETDRIELDWWQQQPCMREPQSTSRGLPAGYPALHPRLSCTWRSAAWLNRWGAKVRNPCVQTHKKHTFFVETKYFSA